MESKIHLNRFLLHIYANTEAHYSPSCGGVATLHAVQGLSLQIFNNYLIIWKSAETPGMTAEQEHSAALSDSRLCRDLIATYWLVFWGFFAQWEEMLACYSTCHSLISHCCFININAPATYVRRTGNIWE